ncbi:MAG: hydrogenase formation protein HypD [Proteobacteria bacterium]|nr:hydrogenase formation protein HypD [Pseudomonadota bacterium]
MDFNETLQRYENRDLVAGLARRIAEIVSQLGKTRLMHVCGTHEHEIMRYGLRQLLPKSLQIIPGPGCPVCICPVESIDQAITLSYRKGITVLTFGDMLRVPATKESLEGARKNGGSVKMVYGPLEAIKIARNHPEETFVFFSIGFETTAAGVAGMIKQGLPDNLFVLMANRYIPPVFELLMKVHDRSSLQGFLLAGHAATITGIRAYDYMETQYRLPSVVAGFTPVDILSAILVLLQSVQAGDHKIINGYSRVVNDEGNKTALAIMDQVFDRIPGVWRGIDSIDGTAFVLKSEYSDADAEKQFDCTPPYPSRANPPGCECHRVMLGELLPTTCKMFRKKCSPSDPYGPCMVSLEGTCHAWYTHSQEDLGF